MYYVCIDMCVCVSDSEVKEIGNMGYMGNGLVLLKKKLRLKLLGFDHQIERGGSDVPTIQSDAKEKKQSAPWPCCKYLRKILVGQWLIVVNG